MAAAKLVGDLQPDLLVLDLMLPRLHGLDLLRRIRTDSPKTKGIVFSMHDDERYVMEALRCGAWGCVLKGGTAADLVNAVRDVLAGRRYLPPERAGKVSAAEFENRGSGNLYALDTTDQARAPRAATRAVGNTSAEIATTP